MYMFGARGDGKHNDTAAIQAAMNAAATAGGGVAHLPSNGTYMLGGGLNALGHAYDGVNLRVDGAVTIPGPTAKPGWPTPEQCGTAEHIKGSGGTAPTCRALHPTTLPCRCSHRLSSARVCAVPIVVCHTHPLLVHKVANLHTSWRPGIPRSLCSVLLVMNVDRFALTGSGSFTGFLFDEHTGPQPAGGNSFHWVNVTNVLVEGVRIAHFDGSMWIHFSQNITVRNVTLFNRNTPEETGNIEVGGMGSHGVPPPLCAWKDGKFNSTHPCLLPGANWQYELNLLRPTSNFTMRDSTVNGGDDNVCIKNDTDGVRRSKCHTETPPPAHIVSDTVVSKCGGVLGSLQPNCTFMICRCLLRTSTLPTAMAPALGQFQTATGAMGTLATLSFATARSGATLR